MCTVPYLLGRTSGQGHSQMLWAPFVALLVLLAAVVAAVAVVHCYSLCLLVFFLFTIKVQLLFFQTTFRLRSIPFALVLLFLSTWYGTNETNTCSVCSS